MRAVRKGHCAPCRKNVAQFRQIEGHDIGAGAHPIAGHDGDNDHDVLPQRGTDLHLPAGTPVAGCARTSSGMVLPMATAGSPRSSRSRAITCGDCSGILQRNADASSWLRECALVVR